MPKIKERIKHQNEKFYELARDQVFKGVFCTKANLPLLKEYLKLLIKDHIPKDISKCNLISNMLPKRNIHEKGKTLDVALADEKDFYNIEVNFGYYTSLHRRNLAYIAGKYAEDIKSKDNYNNMKNFIQINLTKGAPKDTPLFEVYELTGKYTKRKYVDNLIIIEYNIDKAIEMWREGNLEAKEIAILGANKEEIIKMCEDSELLNTIGREVIKLNENVEFTEFMSEEEESEKLHNTLIDEARNEGISQRVSEIAKSMIKENMSFDVISKITGLSQEEIENLK